MPFLLSMVSKLRPAGAYSSVEEYRRRPEFPGPASRNVVFNKNDCLKTKNSVVECKTSENVCEKNNEAKGETGFQTKFGDLDKGAERVSRDGLPGLCHPSLFRSLILFCSSCPGTR